MRTIQYQGWWVSILLPFCFSCGGILGEIRPSKNIVGTPVLEVMQGQESQGLISSPLPEPIKIKLKDEENKGISEEELTITLKEGSVEHQYPASVMTDKDGMVDIQVTLGRKVEKLVLEVRAKNFATTSTLITIHTTASIFNVTGLSESACAAEGQKIGTATIQAIGVGQKPIANTKIRIDITNGRVDALPYESSIEKDTDTDGNITLDIYGGNVPDGYDSEVIVSVLTPDIAGSIPKILKYEVTKSKAMEALSPPIQFGGIYIYAQFTFAVKVYKECHQPFQDEPVSFEWRRSGPGVCEWKPSNSTNWALQSTINTNTDGIAQWSKQLDTSPPGGWPNPLWNEIRASVTGGINPILYVATSMWCDPSTHN
ncbi:MAG: hypothetical protein KDD48_02060 [Bdellovibrionales bacterium]|nr:hypothetical protein [Bdellovibrionales bacterium]